MNKNERLFMAAWIVYYCGFTAYPSWYLQDECDTDYVTLRRKIDDNERVAELLVIAKKIAQNHSHNYPGKITKTA